LNLPIRRLLVCLAACLAPPLVAQDSRAPQAELAGVEKIWDRGRHNAFTDLIRFQGRWYCAFREGSGHVSPDGAVRILTSADGIRWDSAALLSVPDADLRDPKLSATPDNRLMLVAAAALHPPSEVRHQTLTWHSPGGRDWTGPAKIGHPNVWLWRVSWRLGRSYGMGYSTSGPRFLRMYFSPDGHNFRTLAENVFVQGYPNETSLLFESDDSALCLLRRDGDQPTAQLGRSRPPYRGWSWQDLGVRLGGPHMIRLPDGRIVAAGRLYDGKTRTALCWLDPDEPSLREFLALPSGGDTSYPGLVCHDDLLWVSYYSSHEGKASIYLARVRLPEPSRKENRWGSR